MRRVTIQLALWAAPIGLGLALVLLLASAPYFRQGPGVPTAGDGRAWGAMWGALVLIGMGCVLGVASNLAWLALAWRRAHRPSALEWSRVSLSIVLGAGLIWLLFGS